MDQPLQIWAQSDTFLNVERGGASISVPNPTCLNRAGYMWSLSSFLENESKGQNASLCLVFRLINRTDA